MPQERPPAAKKAKGALAIAMKTGVKAKDGIENLMKKLEITEVLLKVKLSARRKLLRVLLKVQSLMNLWRVSAKILQRRATCMNPKFLN